MGERRRHTAFAEQGDQSRPRRRCVLYHLRELLDERREGQDEQRRRNERQRDEEKNQRIEAAKPPLLHPLDERIKCSRENQRHHQNQLDNPQLIRQPNAGDRRQNQRDRARRNLDTDGGFVVHGHLHELSERGARGVCYLVSLACVGWISYQPSVRVRALKPRGSTLTERLFRRAA